MWSSIPLADRVRVDSTTRHRDYILTDYAPAAEPTGRLQPASLLHVLLREAALLDRFAPVEQALRDAIGPDETVWGAKFGPSGLQSVELYFYGAPVTGAGGDRSVSRLSAVLEELGITSPGGVDEGLPYFMCSVVLDRDALLRGRTDGFRVYVQSGELRRKPCGVSYRIDDRGHHLENHYWFYSAADELPDARGRLKHSPHAGSGAPWSHLVPSELTDCHTVCFATKPRADGLYFSRVSTHALATFLERPGPSTSAATASAAHLLRLHAEDFAHLRWDLGFDFTTGARSDGSSRIHKVGIHGIF